MKREGLVPFPHYWVNMVIEEYIMWVHEADEQCGMQALGWLAIGLERPDILGDLNTLKLFIVDHQSWGLTLNTVIRRHQMWQLHSSLP